MMKIGVVMATTIAQVALKHAISRSISSRLSYPMQPECMIGKHFQQKPSHRILHVGEQDCYYSGWICWCDGAERSYWVLFCMCLVSS